MAEQKHFQLTVSKVDAPLFSGVAQAVTVPGVQGELQILPEHEAFISPLQAGIITIKKEDDTLETHEITGGTVEVSNNSVTILV